MLLSVARHRRFYDHICILRFFFLPKMGSSDSPPCFFTCSYIVFMQMLTWDRRSQTSRSLTCPQKLAQGVPSGEAWHDVCGSPLNLLVESLPFLLDSRLYVSESDGREDGRTAATVKIDLLAVFCFPSGIIRLSNVCLGWCKTWQHVSISTVFVFVLSFCPSILLSRDLYLGWVWRGNEL